MKRLAVMASFKLSLYLKKFGSPELFDRFPDLLDREITEEEMANYPEDPVELFFDDPLLAGRYGRLWLLCDKDPVAMTAIQLYLLVEMDGRALEVIQAGMGITPGLTIETAARLTWRTQESWDDIPARRRAYDLVELLLQARPGEESYLRTPFRTDGRLSAWLKGDSTLDCKLADRCQVISPAGSAPAFCRMEEAISAALPMLESQRGFALVHVSGERTSGRRFLARELARRMGRELLMVPFGAVSENCRILTEPWRRVLRELLLTDRLLCLCGFSRPEAGRSEVLPNQLEVLERSLAPMDRPVILTTDESVRVLPFLSCFTIPITIPSCSLTEERRLWEALAAEKLDDPTGLPTRELASKMTLTAGQIARILDLLARRQPVGPWEARDIFRLCYQVLDDGRYQNIRFVDTVYRWEDLRLAPYQKETLQAICSQVENQGIVLDDWQLRGKFPYGRCVSALFSGPPGTGKTMAAQVLASRLGLELYKIDLSQVVDKYIGETEKRLKEVFDRAEKSNMILFFDEADALLGKRSEVKDAKDKYANTEVAYLLQRMEEYSGIVLMATNLVQNIDTAFVRRFRYHVAFTLPGEGLRRQLWEDVLPDSIPQRGINLDYLAKNFELPGSQIKNIALNACYMAAADRGVLTMRHLVESIYLERKKEGKVLLASEFGEYGNLLYELQERTTATGE